MNPSNRRRRIILLLLAVSGLFWLLALLYLARVTPMFLWLGKRIGTPTELIVMVFGPLLAARLGCRLPRGGWLRQATGVAAGISTVAFGLIVAVPMYRHWREPGTPPNPTVPRSVAEPYGLPVFPGAEGFGTRTLAGRGGKVLYVTTLEDDGPGSLREAVRQPFPRTIMFRVGGTIRLRGDLVVGDPFVTIAGQTAPGDGICLRDAGLVVTTHDVLIQHLRVRTGNEGAVDADTNDALQLLGARGENTDGASRVVIDHCSFSWSEDEVASCWYGADSITFSYCVFSEALNRSRHRKRTHSAGLLIGDGSWHVTVHHSLMAHNGFRNPLISGGGTHDIVNNIVYDWGNLPAQVSDSQSNTFVNFIGNRFIPGPTTVQSVPSEIVVDRSDGVASPMLYVAGNIGPHRPGPELDEWDLVRLDFGDERPERGRFRVAGPFPTWTVRAETAHEAYTNVLSRVGATLPRRDAIDARIIAEVRSGGGRMIDSPADVGGYPAYQGAPAQTDSDGDGLPDAWEASHGLDPADPSDGNADRDGDGRTNVEEFLNGLAPNHFTSQE